MWKSSNRLRTIIKKWFGSIMDAPTCKKTTIKLIHSYTWLLFLLTSYIKSYSHKLTAVQISCIKNGFIPAAWWHLCQTSPLCTSHCGNNKSERQTSQFDKILLIIICCACARLQSSVVEPSTDEHTAAEQTARITHLVDQREAIPPPHPSMHLGAEH